MTLDLIKRSEKNLLSRPPSVRNSSSRDFPKVLLQKICVFAINDTSDFRSISLTCHYWAATVKDKITLQLFLRAASPIFLTEQIHSLSALAQYKFYTRSCIISKKTLYNEIFKDDFRVSQNLPDFHLKKMLEFSDYLAAGKGHEIISADSFNFLAIYSPPTGNTVPQENKIEAATNPKNSRWSRWKSKIKNKFTHFFDKTEKEDKEMKNPFDQIQKQLKKIQNKEGKKDLMLTRLEHFDRSLKLSSDNGMSDHIYRAMHTLVNPVKLKSDRIEQSALIAGENAFLDRKGYNSSGIQKAQIIRNYVLKKLITLADPELFMLHFKRSQFFNLDPSGLKKLENGIYHQMYLILKDEAPKDVYNFGELAFNGMGGYQATDTQRWLAITNAFGFDPRESVQHFMS